MDELSAVYYNTVNAPSAIKVSKAYTMRVNGYMCLVTEEMHRNRTHTSAIQDIFPSSSVISHESSKRVFRTLNHIYDVYDSWVGEYDYDHPPRAWIQMSVTPVTLPAGTILFRGTYLGATDPPLKYFANELSVAVQYASMGSKWPVVCVYRTTRPVQCLHVRHDPFRSVFTEKDNENYRNIRRVAGVSDDVPVISTDRVQGLHDEIQGFNLPLEQLACVRKPTFGDLMGFSPDKTDEYYDFEDEVFERKTTRVIADDEERADVIRYMFNLKMDPTAAAVAEARKVRKDVTSRPPWEEIFRKMGLPTRASWVK